jgi:hypothetical protein
LPGVRTESIGDAYSLQSSFGGAMASNYTSQSDIAAGMRQRFMGMPVGSSVGIRFEHPDGTVFARGTLTMSSEVHEHSTGALDKHHAVTVARLAPGSLTPV